MKKFAFAFVALGLAAAPAVAEPLVADDPFVATQGATPLLLGAGGVSTAVVVATIVTIGVVAAGDT